MVTSGISNDELLGSVSREKVSRMKKQIKILNERTEQNIFYDVSRKVYA